MAIKSAMKLFTPNCYVEVGPDGVQAKLKALSMYRGVMRPYPHPRSEAYINGRSGCFGHHLCSQIWRDTEGRNHNRRLVK